MSMTDLKQMISDQILLSSQTHSHERPKDPHVTIGESLPTGINFARCKNGECGTVVRNANSFTTKYKSCPSCGFNAIPETTSHKDALCPGCGTIHPRDELEDSDVNLGEIK